MVFRLRVVKGCGFDGSLSGSGFGDVGFRV